MTDRTSLDDLTSDDLDALYRRLDSLEKHLATEEEVSRRLLQQRQEMAAERFIWQERGDRAEISARANRVAAVEALVRAEQAEVQRAALKEAHVALASQAGKDQAALDRVRALAERWRYTGDRKGAPLAELLTALTGEPHHPAAP